jgi:hypothetical protein
MHVHGCPVFARVPARLRRSGRRNTRTQKFWASEPDASTHGPCLHGVFDTCMACTHAHSMHGMHPCTPACCCTRMLCMGPAATLRMRHTMRARHPALRWRWPPACVPGHYSGGAGEGGGDQMFRIGRAGAGRRVQHCSTVGQAGTAPAHTPKHPLSTPVTAHTACRTHCTATATATLRLPRTALCIHTAVRCRLPCRLAAC